MTTRPGYVWDNTNSEWVEIGQAAVLAPVYYQATAPTSPATGDIWIDSDDDVPSIDSSVFYRWKKTAVGGETTLSGADDAGLSLKYTVGYEELYINGVLQVRGSDYVATTGTTITGLTALVAGDIVTIMSQVAYALADTYTQTAADSKFVNKNVGGLNLVVPTSVTNGTLSTNGQITFTSQPSVNIYGCFTSAYKNYVAEIDFVHTNGAMVTYIQYYSGATLLNGATDYRWQESAFTTSAFLTRSTGDGLSQILSNNGASNVVTSIKFYNPQVSGISTNTNHTLTAGSFTVMGAGAYVPTTSVDGFRFVFSAGTATGTIRIYGYNNGA